MSLQINIDPGEAVQGGPGIGLMTAAGNPWTVPDALAQALVQQRVAVPVNWPGQNSQPVTAMLSSSASLAANTANFNALVADMDPGQAMQLPGGDFQLNIRLNELGKPIRIFGAGRPYYSGGTLIGGTVVRGEVNIQDQRNVELGFFGINQVGLAAGSYPNAITGGSTTLNDSSSPMNQHVHDIILVGRGYSGGVGNSQHGVLFQNGRGFIMERVVGYRYLNTFISRASGARFLLCDSYDAEANAVLFKSAVAGGANDAISNTAIGCNAYATADGYFANFTAQAEDASKVTRDSKFIGCTADASGTATGQATFRADGTGSAASNRGVVFSGCTSRGDRSGAAFLVGDNNSEGVRFVGCDADDFGGFSFRSNATSSSNLPSVLGGTCWRSGFADIINVNGRWAVLEVNGKSFDSGNTRLVSELPDAGIFRTASFVVTDATATTFMSAVVGGGSNTVTVFSDGAAWRIG